MAGTRFRTYPITDITRVVPLSVDCSKGPGEHRCRGVYIEKTVISRQSAGLGFTALLA